MGETDRVSIKTYVPRDQKERWVEHADSLGMSQSEFIRTMVQAGRRDFEIEPGTTGSEPVNPQGETLENRVTEILAANGPLSWEELHESVRDDLSDRLESALETLQAENIVQHSGREGGYRLQES